MMLSDVCLSVACIGPKSKRERPRKTKIAYFQGQKVKVTGAGHIVAASGLQLVMAPPPPPRRGH